MEIAKLFIASVCTAALSGCFMMLPEPVYEIKASNVSITSIGVDSEDAFCKDFALTEAQVQDFIHRSFPISARVLHDEYNYFPCFVKGKLELNEETTKRCDFTVRAGATAEISCEDGRDYIFGCKTCGDLFGG